MLRSTIDTVESRDAILSRKVRHNAKNHRKNQPWIQNMTPEERTTDLEIRLTHLDDTVDQLNQLVARQQERIDRLERMLRQIKSDQEHLKDAIAPDTPEAPPPHY